MEVDVQITVRPLTEGGFSGIHIRARGDGPGVVGGERRVDEGEGDPVGVVDGVHCLDLRVAMSCVIVPALAVLLITWK